MIAGRAVQALSDMRRMLGILGEREPEEPTRCPGSTTSTRCSTKFAQRASVELAVEGQARPLDPGLGLSAYRIIQEGLTNSLKYARGGQAR